MPAIRLGTFNLNNLYSRWSFDPRSPRRPGTSPRKPKDERAVIRLAERILGANPDILAVQEVEDRQALDDFNAHHLNGLYPERVLVEGNDARKMDVALLSKLPLGQIRSHQRWFHPARPSEPIFRRDLLQVEVLSPHTRDRLLWVFVAHLKSRYTDWRIADPTERRRTIREANRLRLLEAESIARIIETSVAPGELFLLCGDLNDTPDSRALAPLLSPSNRGRRPRMVNILARDSRRGSRWTISHRADGPGGELRKEQYDYILVPRHAEHRVGRAHVQRRTTAPASADGSDHDPVYCEVAV